MKQALALLSLALPGCHAVEAADNGRSAPPSIVVLDAKSQCPSGSEFFMGPMDEPRIRSGRVEIPFDCFDAHNAAVVKTGVFLVTEFGAYIPPRLSTTFESHVDEPGIVHIKSIDVDEVEPGDIGETLTEVIGTDRKDCFKFSLTPLVENPLDEPRSAESDQPWWYPMASISEESCHVHLMDFRDGHLILLGPAGKAERTVAGVLIRTWK